MVECGRYERQRFLKRSAIVIWFLCHFASLVQLFVEEKWVQKWSELGGPWTQDPNKFWMVGILTLYIPLFTACGYVAPMSANLCGDWCLRDAHKYSKIISWCSGCMMSTIVMTMGIFSMQYYPLIFAVSLTDLLLFIGVACKARYEAELAERRLIEEARARRLKMQNVVKASVRLSRGLRVSPADISQGLAVPGSSNNSAIPKSSSSRSPGTSPLTPQNLGMSLYPDLEAAPSQEHMIDLEALAQLGAQNAPRVLSEVANMERAFGDGHDAGAGFAALLRQPVSSVVVPIDSIDDRPTATVLGNPVDRGGGNSSSSPRVMASPRLR